MRFDGKRAWLAAVLGGLFLAACGQKGPLYLPEKETATAPGGGAGEVAQDPAANIGKDRGGGTDLGTDDEGKRAPEGIRY